MCWFQKLQSLTKRIDLIRRAYLPPKNLAKFFMVPRVNGQHRWTLRIFATSKVHQKVSELLFLFSKNQETENLKPRQFCPTTRKVWTRSDFKREMSCLGQCIILKVYRLHFLGLHDLVGCVHSENIRHRNIWESTEETYSKVNINSV